MLKKILLLLSVVILGACAPQQELLVKTSSGYPEGTFKNTTLDQARSRIVAGCASAGIPVLDASSNQVICGKTMTGQEAAWAQFLIGNSYSTTPERKARFVMYQLGTDVKVTAFEWIETQMAGGQMKKSNLDTNNQKNSMQNWLYSLGAV